jgi:hypothetical protein
MSYNEADTRAKLIDPAIHKRSWSEEFICREVTAGAVEVVGGRGRRARGRVDYTLRVQVNPGTQPVAVALIEAKREGLPPGHGLDQGKGYAACKRLNVPFVFSSNGHLFVEFNRFTGLSSAPRPLLEFPTPAELRALRAGDGFFPGATPGPTLAPALLRRGGHTPLLSGRRHSCRVRKDNPLQTPGRTRACPPLPGDRGR